VTTGPATASRPAEPGLRFDDRVELDISGMTCAACAARIEKKLNKLPNVRATVNYATERAVVLGLEPTRAAVAVQAVEAAGYGAREVVAGEAPDGYSDRVTMLRNRLLVAAFLTVPLGDVAIVLALAPSPLSAGVGADPAPCRWSAGARGRSTGRRGAI
jgi:Cu+-exporting ATPase